MSLLKPDETPLEHYKGASNDPKRPSEDRSAEPKEWVAAHSLHLSVPADLVRIPSPDGISELSIHGHSVWPGWEALPSEYVDEPDPYSSEKPPHGAIHSLKAFWHRNRGLGYVLLAQVFGTLMNVTTRLLELEGNNGKGMHPFQVRLYNPPLRTLLYHCLQSISDPVRSNVHYRRPFHSLHVLQENP
jgi:hypothetical protein